MTLTVITLSGFLSYLQSLDVQPRYDTLEWGSLVEGGQHGDGGRGREHGYHCPICYFETDANVHDH